MEVPILKKGAIEENYCLISEFPFDVRNLFSILATLMLIKSLSVLGDSVKPSFQDF